MVLYKNGRVTLTPSFDYRPVAKVRKRKNLTYAQKLEIVEMIDKGERKYRVGKKFGIKESTIQGIYQNCEHIKSDMKLAKSDADAQPMPSIGSSRLSSH